MFKTNRAINEVKIYDSFGIVIDSVILPEKINPIPAKRGGFGESGLYYKGCGIVYRNHLGIESEQSEARAKRIGNSGVIYEPHILCFEKLVGLHGIFTFPHQVVFSDCEGGCGNKEQKLLKHQKEFKYSAIKEIVDVISIGIPKHNIYAYRLKELKGGIEDTEILIRYILENDWNTAWDKNLWGDILCYGYVRDIADWYRSDQFAHKLGTVYALLNSLYRVDLSLFARLLLNIIGDYSFEKKMILYYSALIVKKYDSKSCKDTDLEIYSEELYQTLFKILISGKACCHLENDEKWQWVRDYYLMKGKEKYGI